MARQSGKTMKVDVALPLDIYDVVVKLAEESDAPIHHRSNMRVLSPTILHLIGLGIQSLEANPELLTLPIATGTDGKLAEVVASLGKLADRINRLEDNPQSLTPDDVRAIFDAQISPLLARIEALESSPAEQQKPPKQVKAKIDRKGKEVLTAGEFKKRYADNRAVQTLTSAPKKFEADAVLSATGLSASWVFEGEDRKFVSLGVATND
jgi:hypothetical protein